VKKIAENESQSENQIFDPNLFRKGCVNIIEMVPEAKDLK
jgi:hypothetical protein